MYGLCWGGGGGGSSPCVQSMMRHKSWRSVLLVTSLLKGRPNGTAPQSALQAPHWTVGNNAAPLMLF